MQPSVPPISDALMGTHGWPRVAAAAATATAPATNPPAAAPARRPKRAVGRPRAEPATPLQRMVYVLWFVILCDPQFLLKSFGLGPIVRLPLALAALIAISLIMGPPTKGDWLWGIVAWIVVSAIDIPFAFNRGNAIPPLRTMILFYIVGLGVVRTMRTPKQASAILVMLCVVQYLWWGFMGVKDGLVSWHPNLDNFDGYGPLMVIGVGPAYFYALSVPAGKRRTLALLASVLCVVGVVSAFARGSVLTLVVTVAYIWVRAPRKGRTAGIIALALAIVAISASMIDGTTRGDDTQSNFWSEMSTMFDHSEGSTGADREKLWQAAVIVFKHHPVFGVGAENFGPAATTLLRPGEITGAAFSENPNTLYARALHSNYYQLLCEFGLAGVAIVAFLLIQFWRRCRVIGSAASAVAWRAAGGLEDPRFLSLALESGMVAYLVSGLFYNQIFTSWFFSLVIANAMMYSIVTNPVSASPARGTRRRVAAPPAR
jgi:O-antigen ligase